MADFFAPATVYNYMRRVYDYQVANTVRTVVRRTGKLRYIRNTDWERGVFWSAVGQAWTQTQDPTYRQGLLNYTLQTGFRPGNSPRFADDQVCIAGYMDIYPEFNQPDLLDYSRAHLDVMLNEPASGAKDWYWCDALYMAPPSFHALSKVTGEPAYAQYAHKAYWEGLEALWDEQTDLVYRDARFIPNAEGTELREANGEKIFWSRGIGWVLASFARIFRYLDPQIIPQEEQERYRSYFKRLAKAIVPYQHADGFWRASLLDPQTFPNPESSATALITYGLAWGYNQGLLDESYLPYIAKGWQGLTTAVHPNGMLGWVQLPAFNPRPVQFTDNIEYGAGAFLLAGCEVAQINSAALAAALQEKA
ncbi:glycoside hydrolase family 88/105 protein [Psittacicella hinzii]|uniref:Glycosyl hydrolase family 88 n=1 Tax=Psittacicella hinzii TaxID=2028575 RepID=A0A3A1YP21_9GAMM|nr:glycoside hydrolase family 88 protein [Psittacicella hinzii]RIY39246.1 glycosyl hydrolase family 88 [Psittacicella hinzii]